MARREKIKLHRVDEYARDVIEGRTVANKWVRLACQRHLDDRKNEKASGLYFDWSAAQHAIDFFPEFLTHYDGGFDGQPFVLTPHQQFIIGSLFGWKRVRDKLRRFRTAYIEAAKGQGKSPLAAGVGLYCLVCDGESGAEIYSAAVTRDQAGVLFRDARTFAEGSEALREKLQIDKNNIAFASANSFFRPVSSEHRGLDGKRPHVALIDEIHEHKSDLVIRKMSAGVKGRRQALIIEITNAGHDRQSICFQHHEYSEKVLQGLIKDDSWFSVMTGLDPCPKCEAEGKTMPQDGCPDCDDWRDESVWEKANPNISYLGEPFRDYLRRQVEEAKQMPGQVNIVKRLNFCIWTESLTKWIGSDTWAACGFPVDVAALRGRTCYGGLDLSSSLDVTAFVLAFPPSAGETRYQILCRFFIPEDNILQRVKRDRVPYDVWVRQGYITATPGNVVDYGFILEQVKIDLEAYDLRDIGFDRWGSAKIAQDLQEIGGRDDFVVQIGQGFASLAAPTKELEKMIHAQEIAHGNNPVLAWMASNVVVRQDPAGNLKPDKEKSSEKIDGVVAMIMAIDRATRARPDESASVYDTRGVLVLEPDPRSPFGWR